MAKEQTNSNEYIVQAVAEADRVAIQTMYPAGAARTENEAPE